MVAQERCLKIWGQRDESDAQPVNQVHEIRDWQSAKLTVHGTEIDVRYRTGNGVFFVKLNLHGKEYGLFNAELFVLACDIATYIEQYSLLGHVAVADIELVLNQLFLKAQ